MRTRNRLLLALVCSVAAFSTTSAEQNAAANAFPNTISNFDEQGRLDLYGGVVVDQTVTGFGHVFYQNFVSFWRDQPLSDRYSISIHESATARFGSKVWVEYAQRRMFQAFLPPSNTVIRATSEKAAALVYSNIIDTDVQRLLFRDVDIGQDEL